MYKTLLPKKARVGRGESCSVLQFAELKSLPWEGRARNYHQPRG